MKRVFFVFISIALTVLFALPSAAQQYITLGVPTSLKLIEGYEGHKAAQLAVEEINAKGGIKVGQREAPED
jgi:ABC-type branched-subunit amino acid transport system substrate-binding protein